MKRIYVFDDEKGQAEVAAALAGGAVEVQGSDDFDVALETVHGGAFDLLVVGLCGRILGMPLLERLRGAKDKVPAMIVAAEIKQSEMATACKLGVSAMLVRPVAPSELRARVSKLLGVSLEPASAPVNAVAAAPPAGRPLRDVLIADCDGDADGGRDLLRLVPRGLRADTAETPATVIERCGSGEYRLVVVDSSHASLLPQIRALEPSAKLAVVYLRTKADRTDEAHRTGYDTYLTRPYDAAELDEVLWSELHWRDVLGCDGNVLRPAAFLAKSRHLDEYYALILAQAPAAVDALAEACYEEMILDLSLLPAHLKHTPELIVEVANQAQRRGLALRVVAPHDLAAMVRGLPGEHAFQAYQTLDEALAA